MNKAFIACTGLLLLNLPSNNAFAAKNLTQCEQVKDDDSKYLRCLDIVKASVERELQTWINNQIFKLEEKTLVTGRESALTTFKRSQNNFLTFRENNCRWQYLALSPGKSAVPTYKKCFINISKTRITELSQLD
ncbi:lysozyme inhibitor LprI family protein [Thalassomonas haliotis]|uniref:DUF1311 domain-containing protein n=1 Tax=Thalassomonas haliotis TaxID=485448 RepID=A0ABY7VGD8_9GAMM|nr:lysozyme inhibitor LprI family protein [Thalassomonas haliotis]WDE12779.1 DUF1311 domain-containing protein [Thalassomonas haliotis]